VSNRAINPIIMRRPGAPGKPPRGGAFRGLRG